MPVQLKYMVDVWVENAEQVLTEMIARLTHEERVIRFGAEYADEYAAWEAAQQPAKPKGKE